MTDRELLEAAAAAAGLRVWDWLPGLHGFATEAAPGHSRRWNPLADDGDALRLAVKLEIQSGYTDFSGEGVALWNRGNCQAREYGPEDPYASTRRAIVRAAAAMAAAPAVGAA